ARLGARDDEEQTDHRDEARPATSLCEVRRTMEAAGGKPLRSPRDTVLEGKEVYRGVIEIRSSTTKSGRSRDTSARTIPSATSLCSGAATWPATSIRAGEPRQKGT